MHEVKRSPDVCLEATQLISEGTDMWASDDLPPQLFSFKQSFRLDRAALPTNTQPIERKVKLSNHCSIPGRSEEIRSLHTMALSDITQHTARKRMNAKGEEVLERSKKKAKTMFQYSQNLTTVAEKFDSTETAAKKQVIAETKNHFRKKRCDETLVLYKENITKTLPLHKFEKRTGVDHTPLIQGKVPFCEMKKNKGFAPAIYAEVRARNIVLTEQEWGNYPTVIKKLKENEGDDKCFKPVMPFDNFVWFTD